MATSSDRSTGDVVADGPPLSVCQYTTPGLSFAEDLEVYRAADMGGIGIDAALKLGGRGSVTPDELDAFKASGLTATSCFPGVNTVLPMTIMRQGPQDIAERVDAMCRGVRGLAVFEPLCFVCGTGPVGSYEPERARELAVAGLREVARAAADVGAQLALEPMHTSIADDYGFVNDLPGAVALLTEVGEPNVGILADVWHLWDTPDLLEQIRRHSDRIVAVHVDDWRDPTRSWCDRALPGDGIADVSGILGALDEAGYRGWYELEIFSDDGRFGNDFPDSLWKQDPLGLLRQGRARFEAVWRSRRLRGDAEP
jgi:sugar phosphate isomerase/epimerase